MKKYTFLDAKTEYALWESMRLNGNVDARTTLIESVLAWSMRIARTFCNKYDELPDYQAEAMLAVVLAVDVFDATQSRLSTFTYMRVKQHLGRYQKRMRRLARLPDVRDFVECVDLPTGDIDHIRELIESNEVGLSAGQHALLRAVCIEGRTVADVMRDKGVTRQAVSDTWQRGLVKLREYLAPSR